MSSLHRRTFILGGLATAGTLAAGGRKALAAPPANPFLLGIASGEPAPDSVVLWTRLAVSPLDDDGHGGMPRADIPVDWQLASGDRFGTVVASGTVTARYHDAHTVRIVATNLQPGTEYYYRFRARGHISGVGRTRTAPAYGSRPGALRMAFASCAQFESGYYTAYRHLAQDHPDLVLFLGDYIYENAATPEATRVHAGGECVSLADYRRRYAQYKADGDLQAAQAVAPWVVIPDDHEVENNYAGLVRADDSPPLTQAQWVARRAAAYRAYYENMPLRPGSRNNFYRRIHWGTLATFHMLDTRQFRDDQPCGDGLKVCPEADAKNRTITGAAQEKWLLDGFAQHYATWDVIGQQVFFARNATPDGAGNMDAWDGYRASRARIQQGWVDRQVRNPLVLTGDIHSAWANDLKSSYAEPQGHTIGTELVCTSITSGGSGTPTDAVPNAATNPHLKFYSNRRGYTLTTITPQHVTAKFRALEYINQRGAPLITPGSFVIEDGNPGIQKT